MSNQYILNNSYSNKGRNVVNPNKNPIKSHAKRCKNTFLMWMMFSDIMSQTLTKTSTKQINEAVAKA